jgi:hypothetical protein
MAAKKRTRGTTSAVVPITQSQLALPGRWADELARHTTRDRAAATGAGGWPWLSTRGGTFSFGGTSLGEEFEAIVLGAVLDNQYFEERFDPENPSLPSCFALDVNRDRETMGPPKDLKKKESETCATCWANAFGSSDTGKGKACRNGLRVALLYFDKDQIPKLGEVDGARLRVPPTSLRGFDAYVATVIDAWKRPFFTIVTRVRIEDDPKHQFHVLFEPTGAINDDALLEVLSSRADEAETHLMQQPDLATINVDSRPSPRSKKKTTRRKKVVKKKGVVKDLPRSKKKK